MGRPRALVILAALTLTASVLVLAVTWTLGYHSGTGGNGPIWTPVDSELLRPGVCLMLRTPADNAHTEWPRQDTVYLVTSAGPRRIESLAPLRGLCAVSDTASALRFCGLGALLSRNGGWSYIEYEIEAMPEGSSRHARDGRERPMLDGLGGLLTVRGFARLGFRAPVCRRTPTGFEVKRWVLVESESTGWRTRVQLLREQVGRDGTYTRTALVDRDPSSFRGVHLVIPGTR